MRINLTNNVLTVVTNITKEVVEAGLSNLKAVQDGNEVYAVCVSKDGKASFNAFSFTGNTFIDGKLAATIILPMGTTQEDVQRMHGENLLRAKFYTEHIAVTAAEKTAEIQELFA